MLKYLRVETFARDPTVGARGDHSSLLRTGNFGMLSMAVRASPQPIPDHVKGTVGSAAACAVVRPIAR